jgi:protein-L-isoaspartate(D-aspartate) O-methyltransferase
MAITPSEASLRLIKAIEEVSPLSPALRQVFLTVPRLIFVPRYYQRYEQPGQAMRWQLVEADAASVAQNEALVIRLDPATRLPTSSSSQPSTMALQLEALDLQAGQSVLEIGTGTGYNAALLIELVGPTGQVATIDIDAQLVQSARSRLTAVGQERIIVRHGDGIEGFPLLAPYDRIIATGSFRSVPPAWLEQLVPGGILVGNLVGNLASIFLRLVKREDGTADGVFLSLEDKRYIELHNGSPLRHRFPREAWYEQVPYRTYTTDLRMRELLQHAAFLFFLQCERPDIQRYWRVPRGQGNALSVCLVTREHTGALMVQDGNEANTWTIYEYGATELWQQIKECYTRWEQFGKPTMASYTFACINGEQWVALPQSARQWRIAPA